jgi:hypothetical protein
LSPEKACFDKMTVEDVLTKDKIKYDILKRDECRDLLFDSLDAWFKIKDKTSLFEKYFSKREYEEGKVCLFEENVDLFSRCTDRKNFDNKEKLLLFGFILHLLNKKDQKKELRLLRNLLINSRNELRVQNLPNMYAVIKDIFNHGYENIDFSKLAPFNGPQIEDETAKAKFISEHPECVKEIYMLEDTELLEGRLLAFNLNEGTISQHRESFCKYFVKAYNTENNDTDTWKDIHRALLCVCKIYEMEDYAEPIYSDNTRRRFGNNKTNWKAVLTSSNTKRLIAPLGKLLTVLSEKSLDDLIKEGLDAYKDADKDWKYYFIRYKTMNVGNSGIFVWEGDYALCMLNATVLRGYWRDPYLWTVHEELKNKTDKDNPSIWNYGYPNTKKPLKINNLEISNSPKGGWIIKLSDEGKNKSDYDKLREDHSINDNGLLSVKPSDDRIKVILPILDKTISWQSGRCN